MNRNTAHATTMSSIAELAEHKKIEEEIEKAAKEVFLASFVGKWVLRIDPYSNKPTIFLKSKKRTNAKTIRYSAKRWSQDSE